MINSGLSALQHGCCLHFPQFRSQFSDSGRRPGSGCGQRGAQCGLFLRRPVAAFQAQKHGGVGQRKIGLEHEHADKRSRAVQFADDRLVRCAFDERSGQQAVELRAVNAYAGRGGLGYDGEFGVEERHRFDVFGLRERGEHFAHDDELIGAGDERLDPRAGLRRVGRINDADPVAMAEERESLGELFAPVGGPGGKGRQRRAQRQQDKRE